MAVVGKWEVEVLALVVGCLRSKKQQVGGKPHVSVIEDFILPDAT